MRARLRTVPVLAALVAAVVAPGVAAAQPFAYVPNQDSDNVSVINVATNAVATVPFVTRRA